MAPSVPNVMTSPERDGGQVPALAPIDLAAEVGGGEGQDLHIQGRQDLGAAERRERELLGRNGTDDGPADQLQILEAVEIDRDGAAGVLRGELRDQSVADFPIQQRLHVGCRQRERAGELAVLRVLHLELALLLIGEGEQSLLQERLHHVVLQDRCVRGGRRMVNRGTEVDERDGLLLDGHRDGLRRLHRGGFEDELGFLELAELLARLLAGRSLGPRGQHGQKGRQRHETVHMCIPRLPKHTLRRGSGPFGTEKRRSPEL